MFRGVTSGVPIIGTYADIFKEGSSLLATGGRLAAGIVIASICHQHVEMICPPLSMTFDPLSCLRSVARDLLVPDRSASAGATVTSCRCWSPFAASSCAASWSVTA